MSAGKPDPTQLYELEIIRRDYEDQLALTTDLQERRRLHGIMQKIDACIADMRTRLSTS